MARSGILRVKIVGDSAPLEKSLKSAGGKVGKFAGIAAKAGAAAAAGFGVLAVKSFGDFDAAMNQSLAIMGDVSDRMRKDMSDAARDVAKTTTFSASESAEAYFFLASAGLDAKQSIEALPQVAKFAQAGMFDMATATDLATDAQSALGLASDDAEENLDNLTRVTDVLVKANTLANASVEQFATALTQKAGGALRNVGKDVEEGAAVLSVFADQGIKAERAGTILRSTLDGLTKQSRKNAEAFEEYGVSVFDADGNMRNMADITADLEEGLAGMSTEQKEAALAQLGFNQRSREGLLALLGNSDALADYEKQLRSAGGTTEEVADKQMETFNAQLGLLRDRFMDFAIEVGSVIVPKLLQAFDAVERWWGANGPAIMEFIGQVRDSIVQFVETAQPIIARVIDYLRSDGQPAFESFAGTAVRTFTQIRDIIMSAIEVSRASIERFVEVATFIWEKWGSGILAYARDAWKAMREVIGGALDIIRGIFETFAGLLTGDWSRMWDGIKQVLSGAVEVITGIIRQGVNLITSITDAAMSVMQGLWDRTWSAIGRSLSSRVDNIKDTISAVVGFVRTLPSRIAAAARGMWDSISSGFRSMINDVIGWWNRLSFTVPAVDVPGPFNFEGATVSTPDIPYLQRGGEVLRTGLAVVHRGERFSGTGGQYPIGGGQPVQIVVEMDGRQVARSDAFIDELGRVTAKRDRLTAGA